jgi:hypothetical protein
MFAMHLPLPGSIASALIHINTKPCAPSFPGRGSPFQPERVQLQTGLQGSRAALHPALKAQAEPRLRRAQSAAGRRCTNRVGFTSGQTPWHRRQRPIGSLPADAHATSPACRVGSGPVWAPSGRGSCRSAYSGSSSPTCSFRWASTAGTACSSMPSSARARPPSCSGWS